MSSESVPDEEPVPDEGTSRSDEDDRKREDASHAKAEEAPSQPLEPVEAMRLWLRLVRLP